MLMKLTVVVRVLRKRKRKILVYEADGENVEAVVSETNVENAEEEDEEDC